MASAEGVEITISTLDVHGNIALASDIEFEFEDPEGIVSPSSKGEGYWVVTGGLVGEWNLRLTTGSATHDIAVTVTPGQAVRLLAEIPEQNPEEGGSMIMRVYAIDQAGNRIEVPQKRSQSSAPLVLSSIWLEIRMRYQSIKPVNHNHAMLTGMT